MSLRSGHQEEKKKKERDGRFKDRFAYLGHVALRTVDWGQRVWGDYKWQVICGGCYLRQCWCWHQGWRELVVSGVEGRRCVCENMASGTGCLSRFFGQQYFSNICGYTASWRRKLQGYLNSGIVRDASAPNSLCVKTCQLCKKIPNKRYHWFTVSRFRVEVHIIYWSMIQREPKNMRSGIKC